VLIEQHPTDLPRNLGLGRHPRIQIALGHLQLFDGRQQVVLAALAQYPDHIDLRRAFQGLLLLAVFHFDHYQRLAIGRQAFEAAGDGGQGGFVADQQVAVENVRHDHRATRAADVQELPRFGLLGPGRGRAVAVQDEIDVQL